LIQHIMPKERITSWFDLQQFRVKPLHMIAPPYQSSSLL
jgi:hypothetical protein